MKKLKGTEKQDDENRERCVVCGRETCYTKKVPIDERACYVEGSGQLCEKCYCEIYSIRER